jgi:hypothetical protein
MRRRTRVLLLAALCVLCAAMLFARVGGGDSYSGGGSSSSGGSGGSGDGGGELIFFIVRFLFWLTIEHPVVGIPVDILVLGTVIVYSRRGPSKPATLLQVTTVTPATLTGGRLRDIRRFDPNFSEITFADFCYSLYGKAHHARAAGELDRYAPYLSQEARASLASRNPAGLKEVRGIVVGSSSPSRVQGLDSSTLIIVVSYESNYTEVTDRGAQSWYVRELWTLERRRDILSPPPEKAKADHCPRCGAALQTRTDGACDYCGEKIASGAFQWYVRAVSLISRETRGPLLTSNVPEQGTSRATVFQPGLAKARTAFEEANPSFEWNVFLTRVAEIATQLQNAWTSRKWEDVRPLETETLFQMHRYWIDAYVTQRLRNVVDGYRITNIEVVKIDSDAFYDAITVRLAAEGRDYTVDDAGHVVAGSRETLRQWTEYWTLIRTRTTGTKTSCPNCGATIEVGTTGICPYCAGKITSGTFDWVLSRIEQDEAYGG